VGRGDGHPPPAAVVVVVERVGGSVGVVEDPVAPTVVIGLETAPPLTEVQSSLVTPPFEDSGVNVVGGLQGVVTCVSGGVVEESIVDCCGGIVTGVAAPKFDRST
jgi:hypothetical protein